MPSATTNYWIQGAPRSCVNDPVPRLRMRLANVGHSPETMAVYEGLALSSDRIADCEIELIENTAKGAA